MAQYSDKNILDSNDPILCFAASSMMSATDIHGKKLEEAPMTKMSALASALQEHENKLPTILAGQMARGRLFYQQTRIFLFMMIKLEDGRMISPFIVRRHTSDPIDPALVVLSTDAVFRWLLPRIKEGIEHKFSIERPVDATPIYDKIIARLPDDFTIYKEIRHE